MEDKQASEILINLKKKIHKLLNNIEDYLEHYKMEYYITLAWNLSSKGLTLARGSKERSPKIFCHARKPFFHCNFSTK